jgi:hypothetical protein
MESTLPLYGLPFYKRSERKIGEKLQRALADTPDRRSRRLICVTMCFDGRHDSHLQSRRDF